MPNTPAMTTGIIHLMTKPGFITPMEEIPTPDFAVPYAAPISNSYFKNVISHVENIY